MPLILRLTLSGFRFACPFQPALPHSPIRSVLRAGQVADHVQADVELGLRYDADIFPYRQERNPLLESGEYPVDKNNFSRASALPTTWMADQLFAGASGATTRILHRASLALQETGVFGRSLIINFPVSQPDPDRAMGGFRQIPCW